MNIPFGLILLVFSFIGTTLFAANLLDENENTKVYKENVLMTVVTIDKPRNFKVVLKDERGNIYSYSKQWCENANIYKVGSKHLVSVVTEVYKKETNGKIIVREEKNFKIDCKD